MASSGRILEHHDAMTSTDLLLLSIIGVSTAPWAAARIDFGASAPHLVQRGGASALPQPAGA